MRLDTFLVRVRSQERALLGAVCVAPGGRGAGTRHLLIPTAGLRSTASFASHAANAGSNSSRKRAR
jgi:hypothetical protein